jgi:CheY-like chemotaxis protein
MDGHEFITTVRDRPSTGGGLVPAIALTAYGREEDRQAALAVGYQVHLTKPCDVLALTRAIAAVTGAQAS